MSVKSTLELIEEEKSPLSQQKVSNPLSYVESGTYKLCPSEKSSFGSFESPQFTNSLSVRYGSSRSIELKKLQILQKYTNSPERKRDFRIFKNQLQVKIKSKSKSIENMQSSVAKRLRFAFPRHSSLISRKATLRCISKENLEKKSNQNASRCQRLRKSLQEFENVKKEVITDQLTSDFTKKSSEMRSSYAFKEIQLQLITIFSLLLIGVLLTKLMI